MVRMLLITLVLIAMVIYLVVMYCALTVNHCEYEEQINAVEEMEFLKQYNERKHQKKEARKQKKENIRNHFCGQRRSV